MITFEQFFTTATRGNEPYDYQCRLADGSACQSQLIEIPTGLGKTAAVVLAWLWNRVILKREDWPRRLVYCLPMRTLVEQTAGEVKKWIDAVLADAKGELALDPEAKAKLQWLADKSPIILTGGEEKIDWDLHPESEAILIGAQDMLLSRALSRPSSARSTASPQP